MKNADAVKGLAALAQDRRLAVYRLLVQQGPNGMSAGVIAERLELPAATLSFHLKELANSGMTLSRQEGRFVYYSANYARMNALLDYLTEKCCQGSGEESPCAPSASLKRKR